MAKSTISAIIHLHRSDMPLIKVTKGDDPSIAALWLDDLSVFATRDQLKEISDKIIEQLGRGV